MCARLFAQCLRLDVPIWVEIPASSFLWRFRSWKRLLAYAQVDDFITDQCRWRAPFRKRTRFRTNVPGLAGQRVLCEGGHVHIILRGTAPGGRAWTMVAEPYPRDLCATLAGAVATQVGWNQRRFCIAACAKCSGDRIGQAKNPGPRRRRPAREAPDLANATAVEPQTARLHLDMLRDFAAWLLSEGCDLHLEELIAVPEVTDRLLRNYGLHLSSQGESLYIFLITVTALQRAGPSLRHCLPLAWELAGIWREQPPVMHRPPLPEALLRAMAVLSLQWGWDRFAGILFLAFFGVCRPGEPLSASRRHLLLPCDLLSTDMDRAYLMIENPKTRRRGGARCQHAVIRGRGLIQFLTETFGDLPPGAPLYPFSSSAFRRRWDRVLLNLQVPAAAGFTPGCLRGGGAVLMYRSEAPISSILWQMRLRHQQTLEHYLQEVAALNSLLALTDVSKDFIRILAAVLRTCSDGSESLRVQRV